MPLLLATTHAHSTTVSSPGLTEDEGCLDNELFPSFNQSKDTTSEDSSVTIWPSQQNTSRLQATATLHTKVPFKCWPCCWDPSKVNKYSITTSHFQILSSSASRSNALRNNAVGNSTGITVNCSPVPDDCVEAAAAGRSVLYVAYSTAAALTKPVAAHWVASIRQSPSGTGSHCVAHLSLNPTEKVFWVTDSRRKVSCHFQRVFTLL